MEQPFMCRLFNAVQHQRNQPDKPQKIAKWTAGTKRLNINTINKIIHEKRGEMQKIISRGCAFLHLTHL